MCQSVSAKMNQLMNALGARTEKLTSVAKARVAAKVLKSKWAEDPHHLDAVHLPDSTNELRGLAREYPKDIKIAQALVRELCQDTPPELLKNKTFESITYELARSLGTSVEELRTSSTS